MPLAQSRTEALSFEAVYRETVTFVYRQLRRFGIHDGDLEDVTQEVFVVVHRRLDEFDPNRASLTTWLYAIARGVASNSKRSRARRLERETKSRWVPSNPSPDAAFAQRRAANLVQDFLETLPSERRQVFELVDIEGLSAPEVSELLQTKVNTVYSRLRNARKAFKRWIAKHEATNE